MTSLAKKLCLGIGLVPLVALGILFYQGATYHVGTISPSLSHQDSANAPRLSPMEISLPSDAISVWEKNLSFETPEFRAVIHSNAISAWEKKTLGPVWMNGSYTPVTMPGTATAEEVLKSVLGNSVGPKDYKVLDTRHYGPDSGFPGGWAILYDNEKGGLTILVTRYEGTNSWWYRTYPVEP